MILGRQEMKRPFAVVGVLYVRAVPVLADQQAPAVFPGAAVVVGEHVIGVVTEATIKIVDTPIGKAEQIAVGDVVAAEWARIFARRLDDDRIAPGQRVVRLGN